MPPMNPYPSKYDCLTDDEFVRLQRLNTLYYVDPHTGKVVMSHPRNHRIARASTLLQAAWALGLVAR